MCPEELTLPLLAAGVARDRKHEINGSDGGGWMYNRRQPGDLNCRRTSWYTARGGARLRLILRTVRIVEVVAAFCVVIAALYLLWKWIASRKR